MSRSRRFVKKALSLTPVMAFALALTVLMGCGESLEHGHKLRNGVESQDGKVVGYTESVSVNLDLTGYTAIGAHAFRNCRKLKSVRITGGLTSIGEGAFEGCSNSLFDMKKISGVKLVDGWAVGFTDSLSGNVDLSEACGIADGAFARCKTLTDVVIGDKVTRLGAGAFAECSRLRNVTIGRGVKQLNGDEFAGCAMIARFSVSEDNPKYKSFSGLLLTKDGETLVCGINGDVTIPDGVTRIGKGAFQNYDGLTSVTISDGVAVVEDGAFNSCDGLTNVVVGSGVRNLSNRTFLNCQKIESFSVAEESPHYKSVSGMLLTKDGKTLVCGINGNVVVPDGVESIAQEAFRNCNGLTSVAIPDSVKTIGDLAFADCGSLTRVVIGKGAQYIHKGVFLNCRKIESFSVSEENPYNKSVSGMLLTKDGKTLVCGINGNVVVPDGVENIAQEAFRSCDGLTSVTIPDGVRTIGELAFCDCRELTRIVVGKDVANIEQNAFHNCRKIGDVSVSEDNSHYKSVPSALMTKDGKTLICGIVRTEGGKEDGNPLTRTFVCIGLAFLFLAVVGVTWWATWRARKNRDS